MADVIDAAMQDTSRHLAALRDQVSASGQPCRYCRYGDAGSYSWNRMCRNPLVRRGTHDAFSGKVTWLDKDQREMRSGLCGQEARLFEPVSPPLRLYRWAKWKEWPLLAGIALGLPASVFALIALIFWLAA